MKIKRSDIENMVFESVKRCLCENVDIRTLIENMPIMQALEPYKTVFGEDAFQALGTTQGNIFDIIQATYNNATPEQQQEFVARLKGEFKDEDDTWDLDLDPYVNEALRKKVKKVVKESLEQPAKKNGFRGCKDVEMIWHGEWSDPELKCDGYVANYWDIENALYSMAKEEGIDAENDAKFNKYCMEHEDEIKDMIRQSGEKEEPMF